MEEREGKLTLVAKTGGLKLDDEDKWINPTKEAEKNIRDQIEELRSNVGKNVLLILDDYGKFKSIKILGDSDQKQDIEEESVDAEIVKKEEKVSPAPLPKEESITKQNYLQANKPMTKDIQNVDVVPKFEITVEDSKRRLDELNNFISDQMVKGEDFGTIPGFGNKPTLFKSGAEKLEIIYGFYHEFEELEREIDYGGKWVLLRYKCEIFHKKTGLKQSECIGSANNLEPSNKKKDFYMALNTVDKMAQKRAFVGAILSACRVSNKFTQDIEDMKEANK